MGFLARRIRLDKVQNHHIFSFFMYALSLVVRACNIGPAKFPKMVLLARDFYSTSVLLSCLLFPIKKRKRVQLYS